jgi:hypothetical protein
VVILDHFEAAVEPKFSFSFQYSQQAAGDDISMCLYHCTRQTT